jgi:hypothetical protein
MRKRQASATLDNLTLRHADTVEENALGERMTIALYRTLIAPNACHAIVIFRSSLLA